MKLEIYEGEALLAHALAVAVAASIQQHPDMVLGLPTGRTPLALYDELATLTAANGIDWSRVRTFNLDEFVGVSEQGRGSYRRFMETHLFSRVNIRPEHVGFLRGDAADLEAECERYERAIAAAGGIDLMILGIGGNGHIGFNEPCEELPARTHRVRLEEPTRVANAQWFGGTLEAVPREALSMGMATILNAREIVLLATGKRKAGAVRRMVAGQITPQLPASFLQLHPRVTVMLDEAAAAELRPQHQRPA